MCWRVNTVPNFITLCCFLVVSDSFGTDIEYPDTGALPGLSNYVNEEDFINTQTTNTTSPVILNINDTVQSENGDDANTNEIKNLKPEEPEYSAKMYLRQHGNPNIKTSENHDLNYRQNDNKAYDYLDYGNQPGGVPYTGENPNLNPIEKGKQATQYGQNQAAREARSQPVNKILRNSQMLYSQANADVKPEYSRNGTYYNEIGARFNPNNYKSGQNQFLIPGQAHNNEHNPINPSELKLYKHPKQGLLYTKTTPTYSYPNMYKSQDYPVAHDSSPNKNGQNNGYRDNVQMSNVYNYQGQAVGYAPNDQGNAILSQRYNPKLVQPGSITMNNQIIPGPYPFNANSVVGTNVGPNNYLIGQQEQGQPISRAKNANIFSGYTRNMDYPPNNITPQSQVEYQSSVVLNQGFKPAGGYYMHGPANSNDGLNNVESLNAYNNRNGHPPRNSNRLAQNQFQNHNLAAQYPKTHNENTQHLFQTSESQYPYLKHAETNLNINQLNPEEQIQDPENNKDAHPGYQKNQYRNTNQRNHQDPNNQYPGDLNQNQPQNQEHQNQHLNNQDPEAQKQNPNQKNSEGHYQNPEEQTREPEPQNQKSHNQNTEGQNQTPGPQKQDSLNQNTVNHGSEGHKLNFNPPNSEGQNQPQFPERQGRNATENTNSNSQNGTENQISNPQNRNQNPGSDNPESTITQSPEVLKQSKESPLPPAPGVIDYDVIPGWYDIQFSSLSTSFTFPTMDSLLSGTTILAPSTTPHYLVMEAKQMMGSLRWGYFLGFTYKLFQVFAKKDLTDGTHLLTGLKNVVDEMVDSGVLKDMGSPAAPALKTVMSSLTSRPYQDIQNYLDTASSMIREKELALSQDLVAIINIVDAAYTLDEGDKLLEVLVDIDGYPENNLTPTEIGTAFMNGLLQPYWRMAGTPNRDKLLNMINSAVESRFNTRRHNNEANDIEKKGHNWIGKLNKEHTTKIYKTHREHRRERDKRFNKPRNSADVIKSATSGTRSYLRRIPYDDKIRTIRNHVPMGQDTNLYTEKRKLTTRKLRTKHNKYDRFGQTEYNYEKTLRNRILYGTSNENLNRHRFKVKGSKVDSINIKETDVKKKGPLENFIAKAKSDIDNAKVNTHKTVNEKTDININQSSNVSMSNQKIQTEDSVEGNIMKNNEILEDMKREIFNNNDMFTLNKAKRIDNVSSNINMIEDRIKPVAINIAKEEEADKEVVKISESAVTKIGKNITKKIKSEITNKVIRKQVSYKNAPEDLPNPNFDKIQKYNEFTEKETRIIKREKKQDIITTNEEHIKHSKYLNPVVRQRLNFKNNKKYKKSKELNEAKSILRNIIEESSYSDEENQLKRVLSDGRSKTW